MPLPAAGGILTAASLHQAPTSYVPTLTATTTNPTLGTAATRTGFYYRVGDLIHAEVRIRFGTPGAAAGTGAYRVSLPVAANTTFYTVSGTVGLASVIGSGSLLDNSGGATASFTCSVFLAGSSSTVGFQIATNGAVDNDSPWIWADNDAISFSVVYLRA